MRIGSHFKRILIALAFGGSFFTLNALSAATVSLSPNSNIQSIVNANPPGTTFVFQPGVYRMQSVAPKDGDVFDGQGAATLNGSRVLSGFTKSASAWVVGNQTQHGAIPGGDCLDGFPRCTRPEDLFIDNVPKLHVSRLRDVKSGAWFFDYNAKKIYIGDDPAGHTVETSVTPVAFQPSANNVTIKNLTVEKYAAPLQQAAVGLDTVSGWVVTNNTIRLNHGAGTMAGTSGQLISNRLLQNGQEGYAGGGSGFLINRNEIAYNNFAGVDSGWEAGGGKITEASNGVVSRNCVHDNNGPGIWMDAGGNGVIVEDNVVWNNRDAGIFYEISTNGIIRNNVVADNGYGFTVWFWDPQILISSADGVQVYGNTVDVPAAYGNAITIISQNRPPYTPAVNNKIYQNTVTIRNLDNGRLGAITDEDTDIAAVAAQNSMYSNVYHLADVNQDYWNWGDLDRTFSSMRSIGQESGSSVDGVFPTKPALNCNFLSQ